MMTNTIVRRKVDGSLAIITHWNHFYVNRETGSTIGQAFTIKYLNGQNEGISHAWSTHSLHTMFEVVGTAEVTNEIA